ncbi:hypothetical protein [Parapedobacter soli]|uniref:hypothetical protein n=1 Tax=Parapedobacter soli TaxID=416955 RepID=UPI0021C9D0C7|nr:hypothetical protein [Parapedobacter soli]
MDYKTVLIRNLDREKELMTALDERFNGTPMSQALIRAAKMFLTLEKENAQMKTELRDLRKKYSDTRYAVDEYLTAKKNLEKLMTNDKH